MASLACQTHWHNSGVQCYESNQHYLLESSPNKALIPGESINLAKNRPRGEAITFILLKRLMVKLFSKYRFM